MSSEPQHHMLLGKKLGIGVLIAIFGVALVGVPNMKAHSQDDEARKITLTMTEYAFAVAGQDAGTPLVLKAGQLTDLTLTNNGKLVHEIWWGKDTQIQEGRTDGYQSNLLDGVSVLIRAQQGAGADPIEIDAPGLDEVALNPGQSITIEFTLPDTQKGDWEIGCFQPMPMAPTPTPGAQADTATSTPVPIVSHYNVNMKLPLTVK